jgi:riboflavin synthase
MFSGIIEELGYVSRISKKGNNTVLVVNLALIQQDTKIGDSISVNGACLTVVNKDPESLSFEVIPETLRMTNLGGLRIADKVNLERSLKLGDRLSGHFVTGHVDCLGNIRRKDYFNGNLRFEIAVPAEFRKFCLPRGSIAVDGISLTIARRRSDTVTVYVIPHTLKNTTLGFKGPSDKVNLEFDILAKKN